MRKFFVVLLVFFSLSAVAEVPHIKYKNLPQGTFKKSKSGKIIQYDNNGKRIGVYNLSNPKSKIRK